MMGTNERLYSGGDTESGLVKVYQRETQKNMSQRGTSMRE